MTETRTLHCGPLTAVLEDGTLRYIRAKGSEIVRQIYVAVRDRNWGTVPPRFTVCAVEQRATSFTVRLVAEAAAGEIDYAWEGEIEGTADGVIAFAMRGVARSDFLRNRIGFCVLHPDHLAGMDVEAEGEEGTTRGAFPERISPHQPFFGLRGLSHGVRGEPNGRVTIRFEGDLFEMEDQRNWTDASFKTYCTPLARPFPVQVRKGETMEQKVTISVAGLDESAAVLNESRGDVLRVRVEAQAVGTLPAIGFALPWDDAPLPDAALRRLSALRPAFLRADLRLGDERWPAALARAAAAAQAIGAPLDVELFADRGGEADIREIAEALRRGGAAIRCVLPYGPGHVTTPELRAQTASALQASGLAPTIGVGGGSRANFAELNRAASTIPFAELRCVEVAMNPQVHAFDEASIVETLPMQALAIREARRIAGGLPVHAGPITFTQRVNAAATGDPGPRPFDARLHGPFGAAWTVGSLRAAAEAGAASACYYDAAGPFGIMPPDGASAYPVCDVFAALADFRDASVQAVVSGATAGTLETLALRRRDGRKRVLLANVSPQPVRVELSAAPAVGAGEIAPISLVAWETAVVDLA